MTDRYFDWNNGSDSNDGLSANTPKKSYDTFRAGGGVASGDRIFSKRGTPQYFSTPNIDVKLGSSDTARTLYGAYGVAQVPYTTWYPAGAGDFIVNGQARSYIDYQDIYFDMLGTVSYPIYCFPSGASANTGHTFRRCIFTNAKSGQAGFLFGSSDTSTGDAGDYLFEYCQFINNPGHGAIATGARNVRYRRCKSSGNGFDAPFGGHGFSSKYRRTAAISGWTQVGTSTVWQRTLVAPEQTVYYVITAVGSYYQLTENTATPTAPNAGEYGQTGGILYINVNSTSNPSGQSINYAWGRCYQVVYEYCESFGNFADARASSIEGHGFAFDDYTDESGAYYCYSHDNQGAGFSINQGKSNILHAGIGTRNGISGIVGASCVNTDIQHMTLVGNNAGTTPDNGEITLFKKAIVRINNNNLVRGSSNRFYAVDKDTTSTISGQNNAAYGYNAVASDASLTGTLLIDPQLDSTFRPQNALLVRTGVYLGGKDNNGKTFYNPPSIGAVDDITATPRYVFKP